MPGGRDVIGLIGITVVILVICVGFFLLGISAGS